VWLGLSQSGLLPDTRESSDRNIDAWFSCDGDGAWLRWMPELPVTTFRANEAPPVSFELRDDVSNLHFW
jgi:hypothetical protein